MGCTKEYVKGLVLPGAGVAGVGTTVDIDELVGAGGFKMFTEITVYNDADRPVKVVWTNSEQGHSEDFVVPNGGKSYTRVMNVGAIAPASLKVYSIDATAATGKISINLAANR